MTKAYVYEQYRPRLAMAGLYADLWIDRVGHCVSDDERTKARVQDVSIMVYCVRRGRRTLIWEVGGRANVVRPGDMAVIPPGVSYNPAAAWGARGWETWWVHFGGARAAHLAEWLGFSLSQHLTHLGLHDDCIACFRHLCRILLAKRAHCELDALAELYRLLFLVKKYARSRARRSKGLEAALGAGMTVRGVDEMAAAAGLSKCHFVRKFRAAAGIPPWQYLIRQRIQAAKELLLRTDLPMKSIANRVGFSGAGYFATVFRRHAGVSPRAFRAQHRPALDAGWK